MAITEDGVSTTRDRDCFSCEEYLAPRSLSGNSRFRRRKLVQWDYRDASGKLHSGISTTLEKAKVAASRFGYTG